MTAQFSGTDGENAEVPQETEVGASEDETTNQSPSSQPKVVATDYGKLKSGEKVTKYSCENKNGMVLEMIDYGATVIALKTKDKNGKLENITLNCKDIAGYEAHGSYFGCTVGRYCNRIAG